MRIKEFVNYGGSLKNLILGVGSSKNDKQGGFSKKGRRGQLADLRGGLAKKGWCF